LRPALGSEHDCDRQVLVAAAQAAFKGNTAEPGHMPVHDRTHDRVKLISIFPHYLDREQAGKVEEAVFLVIVHMINGPEKIILTLKGRINV
jgi:hypothetical protein